MKDLPTIYVMDRGWVLVGRYAGIDDQRKHLLILNNCHVVRRWGTNAGIGELALKGPQKETILDREGDGVRINELMIHHTILCSDAWSKWK